MSITNWTTCSGLAKEDICQYASGCHHSTNRTKYDVSLHYNSNPTPPYSAIVHAPVPKDDGHDMPAVLRYNMLRTNRHRCRHRRQRWHEDKDVIRRCGMVQSIRHDSFENIASNTSTLKDEAKTHLFFELANWGRGWSRTI